MKPTSLDRLDAIRTDIGWLYTKLSVREARYIRDFNRYYTNGSRRDSIWELYTAPMTYWADVAQGGDNTANQTNEPDTVLNVIKSAIDTKVSKLSQLKVRPFFNPVNGTFKTRKVCRQALDFFDAYFDDQKVYEKAAYVYRNALIFEYGCLYIDDETTNATIVNPWEYYVDAAEYNFGKLSRCMYFRKQYPAIALPPVAMKNNDIKNMLEVNPTLKGDYTIYFDLYNKRKYKFFKNILIEETELQSDIPPFLIMWYNKPIKGFQSTSMATDMYTQQLFVDRISKRVDAATRTAPFNVTFLPQGIGVKETKLSNEAGLVVQYKSEGGPAPTVATPPPIDPEWTRLLDGMQTRMYNLQGISELSAVSKKPAGLNSGVALETYEDVESDRHNVDVMNYEHFLVDIAKLVIEVFPEKLPVLPATLKRDNSINWKDIKDQRSLMTIQFSASSSLSKDPSTKLEQVQQLMKMQMIQPGQAASLLELPDLQEAFSAATAEYDYCQRVIERAIEDENYDFFEVVNFDELLRQTALYMKQLDANNEDPKTIKRLEQLMVRTLAMQKGIEQMSQEPAVEQAGATPVDQATADTSQGQAPQPMVGPNPMAPANNAVPLAPQM